MTKDTNFSTELVFDAGINYCFVIFNPDLEQKPLVEDYNPRLFFSKNKELNISELPKGFQLYKPTGKAEND